MNQWLHDMTTSKLLVPAVGIEKTFWCEIVKAYRHLCQNPQTYIYLDLDNGEPVDAVIRENAADLINRDMAG